MKQLEKDILIVENIIRLLNECLGIAVATENKKQVKDCLKDIQFVKKELNKLITQKEKALEKEIKAAKEPAGDAAL